MPPRLTADGAIWHKGPDAKLRKDSLLPWSLNSPDLNPIERFMGCCKSASLENLGRGREKASQYAGASGSGVGVGTAGDNGMPEGMHSLLDANGGHTKQ